MKRTSLLLLAGVAAVVGCSSKETHPYLHKSEKPKAAEWGYTGDIGPSHWGDLSPKYALAKDGKQQSPIDIRGAASADLPSLAFDYKPSRINLVYNGHTVEEMEDGKSSVTVGGKRYTLEQFHFHSPSEHTINGRHADMEMHLVHKAADDTLAVVAVMINEGAENAAFAPVWDNLPSKDMAKREASATIDASALLPSDHGYYRYMGSLTTPPCTEGVHWMVLRTPIALSRSQIDAFRAVIHGNNRPVQPLNGRAVDTSR